MIPLSTEPISTRWLGSGWRPDISPTSDPPTANHAAEGGNPKARGGVWRPDRRLSSGCSDQGSVLSPGASWPKAEERSRVRGQRQMLQQSGKKDRQYGRSGGPFRSEAGSDTPGVARPPGWGALLPCPSLISLPPQAQAALVDFISLLYSLWTTEKDGSVTSLTPPCTSACLSFPAQCGKRSP